MLLSLQATGPCCVSDRVGKLAQGSSRTPVRGPAVWLLCCLAQGLGCRVLWSCLSTSRPGAEAWRMA